MVRIVSGGRFAAESKIADDKVGANAVPHSGVVARIRTDDVVLFRIEFFKNGARTPTEPHR